MAHQVPLDASWRGLAKLARMGSMAIAESLADLPEDQWSGLPLLLCVAERDRPGRLTGLDDQLFLDIQGLLGRSFAPDSAIIARGRVGVAIAIAQARKLMASGRYPGVVIAAADSLLHWPVLSHLQRQDRLLDPAQSNGFMPGEGAGAIWLTPPDGTPQALCTGVGFGKETVTVDSEEPFRADGLVAAIRAALVDAGCGLDALDYRITDLSGEHYYFKEAALAFTRLLRERKEAFDLWHPAECTGEAGAFIGTAMLAVFREASFKAYAPGPAALAHMADDSGHRAAVVLRFGVA